MKDLLEELKKARNKKIFATQEEFRELLNQIQQADSNLVLDWDDGAGEEWARLGNLENGIVCMISARIGIAFIRKEYKFQNISNVIGALEIVFTEDYRTDNWCIDLDNLESDVPEICWRIGRHAVDVNSFSLDDLYFATV